MEVSFDICVDSVCFRGKGVTSILVAFVWQHCAVVMFI